MVVGIERAAAGESLADPVPVCHGRLAVEPAELDHLAVALAREVDQAAVEILDDDAERLEPGQAAGDRLARVGEGAARRPLLGGRPRAAALGGAPAELLDL